MGDGDTSENWHPDIEPAAERQLFHAVRAFAVTRFGMRYWPVPADGALADQELARMYEFLGELAERACEAAAEWLREMAPGCGRP